MLVRGLLGSAALVLVIVSTEAKACRCAGPHTPQTAYNTADGVAVADVVEVEGNFEAPGGALATVQVSKAWKAKLPPRFKVETRTTCAYDLRAGQTYLLYVTRSTGRAPYATTICRGNLLMRDASRALEWLDRHATPSRVGP